MHKKDLLYVAILAVIVFGLYWKTFNYDLIWDDEIFFKHNLLFIEHQPLTSAFKYSYFSEQLGVQGQDHYYRPLLTLSFLLENELWGIKNITLRLTNLLIFFLSLLFLFAFLKAHSDKAYLPEIVTLLFALYPLNSENIVWVVGRGDLFLLLWGSLTFLFFEHFLKKGRPLYLVGSSFFFLLGVFSKETFILFLPLLLLYEKFRRRKISWPYHLANGSIILLFFFIKNFVLGIKNIKLVYMPNSLENARAALGTLGYYLRTMIFPLRYDMFLPVTAMNRILFLAFGLLALVFIVGLAVWAKKDREVVLPALLFVLFWLGHIPLIYASIFPYQIYSRYMMVAALGLVWLLAHFLMRIKERPRFGIVFLVLILFIPSIVLNAGAYRNSTVFWQRAMKSSSGDAYVLFQAAKTAIENKDYLSAEIDLNSSLGISMKRETAILVSMLYADVEMMRADYPGVLRWMASVEEFDKSPDIKIAPFIRYQINSKKARVFISQGDIGTAEKLLLENIRGYSTVKEAYTDLYNLYVSHGLWPEAAKLEQTMKSIFPAFFAAIDTAKMQPEFDTLPFEKKMTFYIQNRNFAAALALVRTLPSLDLDHQFLLAKLFYYEGKGEEGNKVIQEILDQNPGSYEILNKAGFFYLYNLIRVKVAAGYFEQSLALNPSQPEIVVLLGRLKREYLEKIKDVWAEGPH
jgi:tetratricopeptide (TPR) repeat protein